MKCPSWKTTRKLAWQPFSRWGMSWAWHLWLLLHQQITSQGAWRNTPRCEPVHWHASVNQVRSSFSARVLESQNVKLEASLILSINKAKTQPQKDAVSCWRLKLIKYHWTQGFPGGTSCKEPACQCRRCERRGIDPWVGKIPWRRAWQHTPVFLSGEAQGQKNLVDYSLWGRKKSNTTKTT